jgi:hypothetical protein
VRNFSIMHGRSLAGNGWVYEKVCFNELLNYKYY